jgi:hypothetical protein
MPAKGTLHPLLPLVFQTVSVEAVKRPNDSKLMAYKVLERLKGALSGRFALPKTHHNSPRLDVRDLWADQCCR